jgi:hypothetical protein
MLNKETVIAKLKNLGAKMTDSPSAYCLGVLFESKLQKYKHDEEITKTIKRCVHLCKHYDKKDEPELLDLIAKVRLL